MKDFLPKLKNFWWYHKVHVLIGLAAAAILIYSVVPSKGPRPDYHIGIVSPIPCTEEYLSAVEQRISAAAEDVNGDGQILVRLHPFTVDFESSDPNEGYRNYEKVAALDADLTGKVSGLYLAQSPEEFQKATAGLMAEPFAAFDENLGMAVRKDAPEEYLRLLENLR